MNNYFDIVDMMLQATNIHNDKNIETWRVTLTHGSLSVYRIDHAPPSIWLYKLSGNIISGNFAKNLENLRNQLMSAI